MALPTPPPYTNPIPNNPFYSPEVFTAQGAYYPMTVGSGLSVNPATAFLTSTGGGGGGVTSITAGPGIAITGSTGNVTIINAGVLDLAAGSGISITELGGTYTITGTGVATPAATPTVEGIVYGRTSTAAGSSVSLGYDTQSSTTNQSVALGWSAGKAAVGSYNVFAGYAAGCQLATGVGNTTLGWGTMCNFPNGTDNVAIGGAALIGFNATASPICCNIAIGTNSLWNTTGCKNVAIGWGAGYSLTTGCCNVIIGNLVQAESPTDSGQLAIGFGNSRWLTGNSTGAIKPGAGIIDSANSCGTNGQFLMSNGSNAVCWGGLPVASQTTRGVVYGRSGSLGITDNNVAYGYNALGGLTNNSSRNVAVGKDALSSLNSFDNDNTAVGNSAFANLTTGVGNTALGSSGFSGVGDTLVSGSCNVVIGFGADVSSSTISNQVTISSGSGAQRFTGAGNWAAVSDARDKTDIQDLTLGLDFLKEVKPRLFAWDMRHTNANKGERTSGFVAQEVQAIVEKFDAVDYAKLVDTADENRWMLSQTQFVPILVKAIQELSAKVEELESKLASNG